MGANVDVEEKKEQGKPHKRIKCFAQVLCPKTPKKAASAKSSASTQRYATVRGGSDDQVASSLLSEPFACLCRELAPDHDTEEISHKRRTVL